MTKNIDSLLEEYIQRIEQLTGNRERIQTLKETLERIKDSPYEVEVLLNPNIGFDRNQEVDLTSADPRLEVRDYSLAERVEVVKHDLKDHIYWEINFIFQDVQDSEGNEIPIYCKMESMYFDTYRIARSFQHTYDSIESCEIPCGRPTTLALPTTRETEYDPQEICKYYQRLGVKEEVIISLQKQLKEAYSENRRSLIHRLEVRNNQFLDPVKKNEDWLNNPDLELPALPGRVE